MAGKMRKEMSNVRSAMSPKADKMPNKMSSKMSNKMPNKRKSMPKPRGY